MASQRGDSDKSLRIESGGVNPSASGNTPLADDTAPLEVPLVATQEDDRLRRGKAAVELLEAIRLSDPRQIEDIIGRREAPDTNLPSSIGRFRILRELGRGGHGIVFLAEDPRLRRLVALKVPRPEAILTPEMRRRFLREAEAAAALNHPHIVPIFEQGAAGPICYVASSYCAGPSLAEWLQRRPDPLDLRMAAEIVRVLADAVQHAHSRGVLHRDLKPANVIWDADPLEYASEDPEADDKVRPDMGERNLQLCLRGLRLTDFGLARIEGVSGQTATAAVLGTPAYMAPEQAAGNNSEVGGAADIYSLGVILYQLLTKRLPFECQSDLEVLQAIQTKEPLAPRRMRPEIPRDLEAICLKCLEKWPRARYESAADLAADLARFLAGDCVQARPIRWHDRFLRSCRRNPALSGLAVLACTLFLAGSGSVFWQWQRAEQNLVVARIQEQRARNNLESAQAAVDELLTGIAEELHDLPQTETIRERLLSRAAAINQKLMQDSAKEAEVTRETVRAWARAAEIARALGHGEDAKKLLDKIGSIPLEGLRPDVKHDLQLEKIHALCQLSSLSDDQQNFANANAYLQAGLEIAEKLPDVVLVKRELARAEILRCLGIVAEKQDDKINAGIYFQDAVNAVESLPDPAVLDPDGMKTRAKVHSSLAIHCKLIQKTELAMQHYAIAQDALEKLHAHAPGSAEFQDMLAQNLYNQANLVAQSGNLDEARRMYLRAKDEYKELSESFPRVFKYKDMWCRTLQATSAVSRKEGQIDRRILMLSKATFLREEMLRDHPENETNKLELARAHRSLAKDYSEKGEWKDARRCIQRSIECLTEPYSSEQIANEDRSLDAWSCSLMAQLEMKLGNWDKARAWFETAMAERAKLPDAVFEKVAHDQLRDRANLGIVTVLNGNQEAGMAKLRDVIQAGEKDGLAYVIGARGLLDLRGRLLREADFSPPFVWIGWNLYRFPSSAEVGSSAAFLDQLRSEAIACLGNGAAAGAKGTSRSELEAEFGEMLGDSPAFQAILASAR